MKGKRSSSYPVYSIEYSLSFAEKIYKNYGNTYRAKREEIAEALNFSANSLNSKLSSAAQYGLLDMKSKEGYLVTDLFVQYNRPIDQSDKQEALLIAFKSPSLYSALIEAFEGNILPPVKPLSNILFQKHNISDNACEKAAEIFEENALFVNAITDDRVLKLGTSIADEVLTDELDDSIGIPNIPNQTANKLNPVILQEDRNTNNNSDSDNKKSTSGFTNTDGVVIPILLKDRRTAHLGLPSDAKSSDLDTIINWIRLMKESFE